MNTRPTIPDFAYLFREEVMNSIFPPEKTGQFFAALYGDADDGAFTISVRFTKWNPDDMTLHFEFQLHEVPGRCLACNLTYGLPKVFAVHPVIDLSGLVSTIAQHLPKGLISLRWTLGQTRSISRQLHVIPLTIFLGPSKDD